jgi:hypothetical protein
MVAIGDELSVVAWPRARKERQPADIRFGGIGRFDSDLTERGLHATQI